EEIELRPVEISSELTAELTRIVGPDNVRTDRRTRIFHALGRSYRDLIRIRLGHIPAPPDAVVYPESHDQVRLILDSAARHRAVIVPFGGGSSVVGGVEIDAGPRPNICLDLTRMNRILALDSKSLTARVQTGIFGPGLEEALSKEGFTLGHFPQSFEFSTLGGWIAARGAGHKSTRYGKIEDMVLALRLALPGSEIQTPRVPASAAGGDPAGLFIGSEGALGVITEAEIKIRPLPDREWFTSFLFPNFEAGLAAVRRMLAQGLRPAMLRLSDPIETAALLAEAGADKTSAFQKTMLDHVAPRYLDLRGIRLDKACLLLAAGEGRSSEAKAEKRAVTRVCRAHGAVGTGAGPALAWHKTRYTAPYMRDDMITAGLFIETLETAATWDALPDLCSKVQAALDEALSWSGVTGLVMTHLSHAYPEGANLYFTFIAPMVRGSEEEQWRRAKEAATRAILDGGGALSHHHGVGRDHKAWLQEYWGRELVEVFKAAKAELDPLAIVNPGAVFNPDLSSLKPMENIQPFSPGTRSANIDRFENEVFDLLVVGGGIVGCGVAWDAGLRGLSVALVEKDDFASGTSGKSSRMIHGGLRYLKMLDLKLVRESLSERRNLMRIAPHLVRPVKFLLPVFKGQGDSRTVINLGLWAYETLAGHKQLPSHENLTAQEALKLEPSISSEGLEGGLVYYDGLTDDARLTLETAKAAARAGAAVANYVEAVSIPFGDNEVRACLKDRLSGREIILKARTAVNAAGVWADRVRAAGDPQAEAVLRPAKGIHIVFPRSLKPISHVIILKGSDGRPLFAVPLGKMIYVGTTDSDYQGDLDKVHAQADEVEYLLEAFNLAFSGPPVTRDQVTASWAGLRPLVAGGDDKETRDISREHEISVEGNRLVTVSGGKLTTFRLMAAQTVDKVFSLLQPKETPQAPTTGLPLCRPRPPVIDKDELPPQVMARLNEKYGRRAADIIALTQAPLLAVELDHELGLIAAEVYWAVQEEMAMTLPDAMVRRLGLTYLTPDNGLGPAWRIASLMADLLDWTPEETQNQLRAYKDLVNQELSFRVS
ncbi:MAG: FAD-dependent oxidoreductase, partial [Thermodesulfobacteriota bacterium]|nr:FAD-dependent oxidoreductase [Thermodesulfobacteriota bacterium]